MPRRRDGSQPPALKRFGQHFLADRAVLARIVDALQLTGIETVVEIGPGRGALTELLRPSARRLVLVEIDRALAAALRERFAGDPDVTVLEGDVLETDLPRVAGGPYVLAGNVPYYITTPIIFQALQPPRPERAVFLVQKEVADRLAAAADSDAYGALSVNVQVTSNVEILFSVPPRAFRPPPKVDSSVVRVTPLARPLIGDSEIAGFQRFVQAVFGMRRKQLQRILRSVTSLSAGEVTKIIASLDIPANARPETLSPEEFVRLFERVSTG